MKKVELRIPDNAIALSITLLAGNNEETNFTTQVLDVRKYNALICKNARGGIWEKDYFTDGDCEGENG